MNIIEIVRLSPDYRKRDYQSIKIESYNNKIFDELVKKIYPNQKSKVYSLSNVNLNKIQEDKSKILENQDDLSILKSIIPKTIDSSTNKSELDMEIYLFSELTALLDDLRASSRIVDVLYRID